MKVKQFIGYAVLLVLAILGIVLFRGQMAYTNATDTEVSKHSFALAICWGLLSIGAIIWIYNEMAKSKK